MKILRDEQGQTLALTAVSMAVLLGFMGLALDVGVAYHTQRHLQTAADAAAVAAALNYQYIASGDPSAAGKAAAVANYVDAQYVTVKGSPTDGYHQGLGFFEVTISQPATTFLAKMVGTSSYNVAARAVAGVTAGSSCMYVLNPSSADAFKNKGNGNITATNCGIQVDSLSPSSFCDQGNASITAPYVRLAGGQDSGGGCSKAPGSVVQSGYPVVNDPFASKSFPPLSACDSSDTVPTTSVNSTTNVASYTKSFTAPDGLTTYKVTCFSANTTLTGVTLGTASQGQIFVFENGVSISGNVAINGTMDIYQGSLTQGNGNLNLTAPADKSLTYNGLALVEPSTNTTSSCQDGSLNNYLRSVGNPPCLQVQFGASNEDLNGYIYAPNAALYLQDQGGGVTAAGIIANDVVVNSNLKIKDSYNHAHPSTTPLSKITLVE